MPAAWGDLYRRAYEGANYRLRGAAGGRFASWCRPTSIVILLTELCNARCVHCDIWKNKGKEDGPTFEEWKTVLRDLRSWLGPVHIAFSGGEGMLRPFTTDLAAYASSLAFGERFGPLRLAGMGLVLLGLAVIVAPGSAERWAGK